MKEQVSFDDNAKCGCRLCIGTPNTYTANNEVSNLIYAIRIPYCEYQRLKCLDENIKNRISAYKGILALNAKTRSLSLVEIESIEDAVRLLECLDK